MKIVFAGGGTGGHFFPIIAVAEEILNIVDEKKLLPPDLIYIADKPFNEKVLFEHNIRFKRAPAGKVRMYFSILNFFDFFKTLVGILKAIILLFNIYPDIVFSKGGYPSFPIVVAARFLRIPVFIHDSDAVPGRANLYAAKYAVRIAIAYPEAIDYFKAYKEKVALIGNPVRKEIQRPTKDGSYEYLGLDPEIPTLLFLGGSQGAQAINDVLLEALPDLIQKYQIIHQTGANNFESVSGTAKVVLENNPYKHRYKAFGFLNDLALKMSAGITELIIARSGSNTIAEIASWEKPAILIPIPESVSRDQRKNAYAYARTGASIVIEQANLTHHLLVAEINRIMEDEALRKKMREASKSFQRLDAARKLAEEIVHIALQHEA